MKRLSGQTVIVIHGWSDHWESMKTIGKPLRTDEGAVVHYVNYESREDSAVYEDFAEGLQTQLQRRKLLKGEGRSLHFVTHSTGALVLRQWFKQYPENQARVGNVVFLAPANFGSPLAHRGRSTIGKIFRGRQSSGDRFEVGEKVLHGLELASPLSWSLADHDLFGEKGSIYHKDGIRASVITGHSGYKGMRRFINEDGTDGTIVVAGANLNSRKLTMDFSRPTRNQDKTTWYGYETDETVSPDMISANIPFAIHDKHDHATIVDLVKNAQLCNQVVRCLATVPSKFDKLSADFAHFSKKQVGSQKEKSWQQILFRLRDERGNPVDDYHLEFNIWRKNKLRPTYSGGPRHIPKGSVMTREEERKTASLDALLDDNLHTHSQDSSLKRYLMRPDKVRSQVGKDHVLTIRIDADSGDRSIQYKTELVDNILLYDPDPLWNIKPFFANTTTLLDVSINRGIDPKSPMVRVGRKPGDFA
jgi:pimeloyl-ACP methyl ester carboxylesterase